MHWLIGLEALVQVGTAHSMQLARSTAVKPAFACSSDLALRPACRCSAVSEQVTSDNKPPYWTGMTYLEEEEEQEGFLLLQ